MSQCGEVVALSLDAFLDSLLVYVFLPFTTGLSILCDTWFERRGTDCLLSLQLFA